MILLSAISCRGNPPVVAFVGAGTGAGQAQGPAPTAADVGTHPLIFINSMGGVDF